MTIASLRTYYKTLSDFFTSRHPELQDKEYRSLYRLAKLTEEIGELHGAAISEMKLQRKEKQDLHNSGDFEKEWADVFSALMLVAVERDMDVPHVLTEHYEKINQRYSIPSPKV